MPGANSSTPTNHNRLTTSLHQSQQKATLEQGNDSIPTHSGMSSIRIPVSLSEAYNNRLQSSSLSSSPLLHGSVNLHRPSTPNLYSSGSKPSNYFSSAPSSKEWNSDQYESQTNNVPTIASSSFRGSASHLNPSLLSAKSSCSDLSGQLNKSTRASTPSWVTTCPSTSIASAAQLANLGVGFGAGINPNVSSSGNSGGTGASLNQLNPPIVNTGNNGP